MFCKNCHAEIDNAMKFCPHCGTKVEVENNEEKVELKKIEPKILKPTPHEETSIKDNETNNTILKKVDDDINIVKDNISIIKDETNLKEKHTIMANISDKDLDKPVYKTKVVIFGVLLLIIFAISTFLIITLNESSAKKHYSNEIITDYGSY